jgi:thiamine-monophosphate kinase
MSLGEFDLIKKYFVRSGQRAVLGVGDDCALLATRSGMQLSVTSDMLVEGRHFLSTVPPERLGHKALAVNLSDLAACGAEPMSFTLSLSLPRVEETFLEGFAQGLFALADAHGCELVGGDTTQGPLNVCITAIGEVPAGEALLRSGARAGDDIYVSGAVGDARLALEAFRANVSLDASAFEHARRAMECPVPRVVLGVALRGVAHSAIDVSDGLLGDLTHILERSGVGATVDIDAVPRSAVMEAQPLAMQRLCTLAGGDDYELVFTAPCDHADQVRDAARRTGVRVTRIGHIEDTPGLRLIDRHGNAVQDRYASYDHFRS